MRICTRRVCAYACSCSRTRGCPLIVLYARFYHNLPIKGFGILVLSFFIMYTKDFNIHHCNTQHTITDYWTKIARIKFNKFSYLSTMIFSNDFRCTSGTFASSAGYPTGSNSITFSFSGLPKSSRSATPAFSGVVVTATRPAI